jgi:1,4-alpha-glucan branching enzyme
LKGEQIMVVIATKLGEATFVCNAGAAAKEVYLAGDFNHWDTKATRMTKSQDGSFRAKLQLRPSEYQYKFIVDGQWMNDKDAMKQVPNRFGTTNSLIKV